LNQNAPSELIMHSFINVCIKNFNTFKHVRKLNLLFELNLKHFNKKLNRAKETLEWLKILKE